MTNGAAIMTNDAERDADARPVAEPSPAAHAYADRRTAFLDDPRRKSPWLAAILSAMPGLGQIYVGYYRQGFVNAVVVGGLIALLAGSVITGDMQGVVGFLMAFFWLFNVIDAARRASLYNQALAGLRPMDLPEDARAPYHTGSLIGGLALIAAGFVLFGRTMYGMSLQWVEHWWPMAIVGVGVWLVYEDWRSRQARRS
jgi:TM2 domain-containing membrane protein YozV